MLRTSFLPAPRAMWSARCWSYIEPNACPPRPPSNSSLRKGLSRICLSSVPKKVCETQISVCLTSRSCSLGVALCWTGRRSSKLRARGCIGCVRVAEKSVAFRGEIDFAGLVRLRFIGVSDALRTDGTSAVTVTDSSLHDELRVQLSGLVQLLDDCDAVLGGDLDRVESIQQFLQLRAALVRRVERNRALVGDHGTSRCRDGRRRDRRDGQALVADHDRRNLDVAGHDDR